MAELAPIPPATSSDISLLVNPSRQQWPDVILTIAAKGRLLPGAGGRIGEAGDAATGYASARPLPIWCVLEERSHPGSARFAEQAFERALHLAAEHGCVSIGVLVDPRKAKLMPVEEVTETALRVFRELSGKHPFRSIHFLPADSFIP